jgi:hypothetical protein
MADGWQVVEVTGVGFGEMWYEIVVDGVPRDVAESRANRRAFHVAIPMPSRGPEVFD